MGSWVCVDVGQRCRVSPWLLLASLVLGCELDDRTGAVLSPETGGSGGSDEAPSLGGGSGSAALESLGGAGGSSSVMSQVPPLQGQGSSSEQGPAPVGVVPGADAGAAVQPVPGAVAAPCFEQLLANGDFEAGHSGWEELWDLRETIWHRDDPLLVARAVAPHAGDYSAWLGGVPNGEYGQKYLSGLTQVVSIPAEAISVTFSGYYWVRQEDMPVTGDWFVLEFIDPAWLDGYDGLWQVELWNADSISAGWQYFEVQKTDVERLRGGTFPVVVDSRPDGGGSLSLHLDSLRLEARCPR